MASKYIGEIMKIVPLEVGTPQDTMNDFLRAWHTGKKDETAKIEFSSPEVLWKVLTTKRWELLKALCGAGPISIRETARCVNRDVKGVHTDLTALMSAGIVNRTETGGVEFPFEAVKVVFFSFITQNSRSNRRTLPNNLLQFRHTRTAVCTAFQFGLQFA